MPLPKKTTSKGKKDATAKPTSPRTNRKRSSSGPAEGNTPADNGVATGAPSSAGPAGEVQGEHDDLVTQK